jgi:hypothetical protein
MRDADFPAAPAAARPDLHTVLLVTRTTDAALASLLASTGSVAIVSSPADAASILQHVAVDIVMVLDDVSAADRTRLETRAGAATFVAGVPALAPIPRALEFAADSCYALAA